MLLVFVEGHDDELFFSKVFYDSNSTKIIPYAQQKCEWVNKYIRSIKKTPNCDYLFFGDADGKEIQDASAKLLSKYGELEPSKLFIVQYEIESWYYAGVKESDCLKLKLSRFEYKTDNITKEMLLAKMSNPVDRQFILARMLDLFSIDLAEDRNTTFKTFSDYRKKPAVAV